MCLINTQVEDISLEKQTDSRYTDYQNLSEAKLTYGATCIIIGLVITLSAYYGYSKLTRAVKKFQEQTNKQVGTINYQVYQRTNRAFDEESVCGIPANSSAVSSLHISTSMPEMQEQQKFVQKQVSPVHNSVISPNHKQQILRQSTVPIASFRSSIFRRQLSHPLDIQFAIVSVQQGLTPPDTPPPNLRPPQSWGALQPELYKSELIQQNIPEGQEFTENITCGKLHFSLQYDQDVEGLVVKVLQAKDLPAKDFNGLSDPYVRLYLLPNRKKKFQTRVHRNNLNPDFNETFIFSMPYSELKSHSLQFSVYDFDRFSRNDLIGQVLVTGLTDTCDLLQEIGYVEDILANVNTDKKDLGEVMLSLCYLPTAGRLTVTVVKARNLRAMDITGSSDPYVKVWLHSDGKRLKKKKTSIKKSTLNPVFNEALVFDIPTNSIDNISLLVTIIDYDRVGANEVMGCCSIGSEVIGVGKDHWLEMLDNPRKPIAQWYPLQDSATKITNNNKDFKGNSTPLCSSQHRRLR